MYSITYKWRVSFCLEPDGSPIVQLLRDYTWLPPPTSIMSVSEKALQTLTMVTEGDVEPQES